MNDENSRAYVANLQKYLQTDPKFKQMMYSPGNPKTGQQPGVLK